MSYAEAEADGKIGATFHLEERQKKSNMPAWQSLERKDAVIAKQEAHNDELKAKIKDLENDVAYLRGVIGDVAEMAYAQDYEHDGASLYEIAGDVNARIKWKDELTVKIIEHFLDHVDVTKKCID